MKAPSPPPVHLQRTLDVIATLRCVGPQQLHALAYGRTITPRAAEARTARLVRDGYVQRSRVVGVNAVAYYLTEKGRRAFPRTAAMSEQVRRCPSPDIAFVCLQRSMLWAALADDGWTVGCDPQSQLALRRHLLDRQKARAAQLTGGARDRADAVLALLRQHPALNPPVVIRCDLCRRSFGRTRRAGTVCDCGGNLAASVAHAPARCVCGELIDVAHVADVDGHAQCGEDPWRLLASLPFDVAVKGRDLMLLVVDDVRRSVAAQVAVLPLRTLGQPRLRIVLRPSDDDSLYDASRCAWVQKGPRFRLLERYFAESHLSGEFPFSTTTHVVEFKPEVSLRVLRTRTRTKENT